jgi:hypothetical protein
MILRVARNPNCIDLEPTELREVSSPVEISRLRIRWKSMAEGSDSLTEEYIWADIWGWTSAGGGSATLAYAQRVIDPDGDEGIIIYGGDWGVKLLVRDEEIGRNVLWVGLDLAPDNLPPETLGPLGLEQGVGHRLPP